MVPARWWKLVYSGGVVLVLPCFDGVSLQWWCGGVARMVGVARVWCVVVCGVYKFM